jgi:chromosomal replication initiator protein
MHHALWQSVLGEIELSVSHANFTTWFKNTELIDRTDDSVTIAVPNIFAKRQFEVKFDDQIKSILEKNGISPRRITYTVKTFGKKTISRETTAEQPLASSSDVDELLAPRPKTQAAPTNGLNPRYTLSNFIVGSSNDLAYAACQAVAANPGIKYNPLFLYGGVGLGKTHLMQAVGNEIIKNQPGANVVYINTETFTKEFVDSMRFKKKTVDKYRNADVLIVDDMQFIAGKEKTQEEFFHTFNVLHQSNRQIIISSDKPPKSIPTLTERLRSRFEWGMSIDIQMPDFETRCAIVETKASLSGIELSRDTVEYLATNIKTNVRELEGALNQLLAYAEMRGVPPDISTAEGLIGNNVRQSRPQHVTAKQIIDKTARHFQIDVREICSAKRDKHIVVPRQVAMYLLRSELHLSFPKIAVELGRKDHTTAIHSVEKIEKAIKLDFLIREQVAEIREKLYA